MNNNSLKNKVALVTGASGGIGQGIALSLVQAGAKVVLQYNSGKTEVEKLVKKLNRKGQVAKAVRVDLANNASLNGLIAKATKSFGQLDILVNNAGAQDVVMFDDLDSKQIENMLKVNLHAPMILTKSFADNNKKGGSVINISSIEGVAPALGHSHYATSKAGLIQFTKAAAIELGSKDIRVNAICPGLINRPGLEKAWPQGVKSWKKHAPLKKLGTPEDIGNAVVFFASPASKWITGSVLAVDGGMLAMPAW